MRTSLAQAVSKKARPFRDSGARLAAAALVAWATFLLPAEVGACGGLFCSQAPVDQSGERIIFTVDGTTVRAIVQIAYSGERDDFAWVVPVPEAPELDTFPQLSVSALDRATAVVFQLSPECSPALINGGGGRSASTVRVLSTETVGPYDTAVIQGESATELVGWLRSNEYRVLDSMVPLMQPYVDDGMAFLAMKLSPESDLTDIEPIVMTYSASEPTIPLRLTAVAAEPEMRVTTWILADERWGPANYVDLEIDDSLIELQYQQHNYYSVVSREVDRVGGLAFVTEYAGSTAPLVEQVAASPANSEDQEQARDALAGLLEQYSYVTRLFTRISPSEMKLDPAFRVSDDQSDVSNVRDLSDVTDCDASVCFDVYCGPGATCIEQEQQFECADDLTFCPPPRTVAACVCPSGTAARAVQAVPGGIPQVYCEALETDLSGGAGGGFGDPCAVYDCGAGSCIAMNGTATCDCDEGAAAHPGFDCATGVQRPIVWCGAQRPVPLESCPAPTLDSPASPGGSLLGPDPDPVGATLDGGATSPMQNPIGPGEPSGAGCQCRAPGTPGYGGESSLAPFLGLIGVLAARWRRTLRPA